MSEYRDRFKACEYRKGKIKSIFGLFASRCTSPNRTKNVCSSQCPEIPRRRNITIAELKAVCDKAVKNGKGDCPVYFDSCAVCFDVHMVEISHAIFEPKQVEDDFGDYLGLHFEMRGGVFHFASEDNHDDDN